MSDEQLPPDATQTAPAPAAKPLLNGPKRQHFLPRFYLEGFAKDGMVAVFDREKDEVRMQQPVNTGVIGHFYTMEDADGRRRFELEQLLSEYEGKAKPVITKLSAKEKIDADERTDLAIFIALGAMRTPDVVDSLKAFNSDMVMRVARQMFSDVEEVKEQLRGKPDSPSSEEELTAEAELMVQMAQNGGIEIVTKHRWAVGMAFRMAMDVAPILAGRDWVVVHRGNDKTSFVTTDAPVLLTTVAPRPNNFWGVGFGNADALVFFPMNEACLLSMFGQDGDLRHVVAGADRIRQINLALASKCQRFVIGRDEALVRSLADRAGLVQNKWRPKMQSS